MNKLNDYQNSLIAETMNIILQNIMFEAINQDLRNTVKELLMTNLSFVKDVICDSSNNDEITLDSQQLKFRMMIPIDDNPDYYIDGVLG
jgi:hypothetical protein